MRDIRHMVEADHSSETFAKDIENKIQDYIIENSFGTIDGDKGSEYREFFTINDSQYDELCTQLINHMHRICGGN